MPARIALFLLLPLTASAEPGPAPHEHRTDRHGHPLPAGAVARLGVPPAVAGFPWALGWTADGKRFVAVDYSGVTVFDAATGRWLESQAIGTEGRSLYTPLSRDGRLLRLWAIDAAPGNEEHRGPGTAHRGAPRTRHRPLPSCPCAILQA